jgi:DNA (cytosine-5)-methyltransferase 1
MKILNLYAGIGGNRKLWSDQHEITAVEYDPAIAGVYKTFFPKDDVIVADAHDFLLQHHAEFDFIWSSPPCQTHSQFRFNIGFKANRKYRKVTPVYPDMKLYQEIILLKSYYGGKWVVENTIPYYEPLIAGIKTGGHIWWSNFPIPPIDHGSRGHCGNVQSLQKRKMMDLSASDISNKRQILRNCVEPRVGLHVFESVFKKYRPALLAAE